VPLRALLAFVVACSVAPLTAGPRAAGQKTPSLAERFPAPPGYSVEQDTESDGARDFSTASGVGGHILRRFVQAGDDGPMSVPDIARFYADQLHAQNGMLFDGRVNNRAGRIDGRIPGARPVWLHVDISDDGNVVDVIALEERAAASRTTPVEETRIAGSWTTDEALGDMPASERAIAMRTRDTLSTLAAPFFKPFMGWAWRVTVEVLRDGSGETVSAHPYRVRVSGRQRSQACATCPVTTDAQDVIVFTMDVNRVASIDPGVTPAGQITRFKDGGKILITRAGATEGALPFAVIDIPWKYGVGEVSLYQRDLVEAFLASAALADLVK
jgi:hypothetical protein